MSLKINFFEEFEFKNKEEYVKKLTRSINETESGYAGFLEKEYLEQQLIHQVFGKDYLFEKIVFDDKKINNILKTQFDKSNKLVSLEDLDVYVFPCFNSFVKEKMKGVTGFTPYNNTVFIYLNPSHDFEDQLEYVFCHEYNHAVIFNHHKWETTLDSLIFEGMAENFSEAITNKVPITQIISKSDCEKYFSLIKKDLHSKDNKKYFELFFGTGKYPLWLGYNIGYHIVKEYLENVQWSEVVKTKPEDVLKKTSFY
jgi:uncharacterized protein YjaZ